ncbi:MAG: hypothetical protein HQL73_07885 [Magnetococcales bacterium]|nr:hypothetical protein [Magnetococcales bacterium]
MCFDSDQERDLQVVGKGNESIDRMVDRLDLPVYQRPNIRHVPPRGEAFCGPMTFPRERAFDSMLLLLDPNRAIRHAESKHFATPNQEAWRLASKGSRDVLLVTLTVVILAPWG